MSPVTVDELTTEVEVQPGADGAPAAAPPPAPWKQAERQRALHARLERDARRTRAEGFDA